MAWDDPTIDDDTTIHNWLCIQPSSRRRIDSEKHLDTRRATRLQEIPYHPRWTTQSHPTDSIVNV